MLEFLLSQQNGVHGNAVFFEVYCDSKMAKSLSELISGSATF